MKHRKIDFIICPAEQVESIVHEGFRDNKPPDLVVSFYNPVDGRALSPAQGGAPDLTQYEYPQKVPGIQQVKIGCWDVAHDFKDVVLDGKPHQTIRAPQKEDVLTGINAFKDLLSRRSPEEPLRIIVHCHRGLSRSTAMLLAFLRELHGPDSEALCVRELLTLRPEATPCSSIVATIDNELGSHFQYEITKHQDITARRNDAERRQEKRITEGYYTAAAQPSRPNRYHIHDMRHPWGIGAIHIHEGLNI